jgi:ureidoacrylate peracid hydrolase
MPLSALDPRHTALVITDMQNAFAHPEGTLGASGVEMSGAGAVIERIRQLVLACKAGGVDVIWTVQEHLERDAARERKRLVPHTARRVRVPALEGSWDAAIVDELKPLADDPTLVIRKHRMGIFYATELEVLLRAHDIDSLIVTGGTANACVDTTLREAYERDFNVIAVEDCIIPTEQAWYDAVKPIWARYLGELVVADEVHAWLDAAAGAPSGDEAALEGSR